jgi:hypothetical protein
MTTLIGCDFSSSPSKRKSIAIASGALQGARVQLSKLERITSLDGFSAWLQQPHSWIGGFDLPFGLPRELIETLDWPLQWEPCIRHYASLARADIRAQFAAFCEARPVGGKFAHRATDIPAKSSSSMKWINPPVAYMLQAGVPRLLDAGVYFPGLQQEPYVSPVQRIALEAYPGLLARELIGSRSYKSDDKAKQTPERLIARKDIVHALEMGQTRLQLRLKLSHAQRDELTDDASGDALDAVLCMVQAAWAVQRYEAGDLRWGLPTDMDPLEGWILTV